MMKIPHHIEIKLKELGFQTAVQLWEQETRNQCLDYWEPLGKARFVGQFHSH